MAAEPKSVGIVGASGFIGRRLAQSLHEDGWTVIRFSRTPPPSEAGWRVLTPGEPPDIRGLGAVINLAGESIARRWTRKSWARIRSSRVDLTQSIVAEIARLPGAERPKVLLNATAVGFYSSSGSSELSESTAPGSGRLQELCREWEAAAVDAEEHGVRVVRLRMGIVVGRGGESWRRLRKIFALGLGGRLGSGRQWMPWIHLEDVVSAIVFALEREGLRGPLNVCAPEPVTNREFTKSLASALHRPAFFHVPAFVLRLVIGGFSEGLLASQRVRPVRLEEEGFSFRYPTLGEALEDLVGSRRLKAEG